MNLSHIQCVSFTVHLISIQVTDKSTLPTYARCLENPIQLPLSAPTPYSHSPYHSPRHQFFVTYARCLGKPIPMSTCRESCIRTIVLERSRPFTPIGRGGATTGTDDILSVNDTCCLTHSHTVISTYYCCLFNNKFQ